MVASIRIGACRASYVRIYMGLVHEVVSGVMSKANWSILYISAKM